MIKYRMTSVSLTGGDIIYGLQVMPNATLEKTRPRPVVEFQFLSRLNAEEFKAAFTELVTKFTIDKLKELN